MKKTLISLILQADKNNNIHFISIVNDFLHNEMEQPEQSLNSFEECMNYLSSLNNEDFICLYIILINKLKLLSFEEEAALIKAAEIFLQ